MNEKDVTVQDYPESKQLLQFESKKPQYWVKMLLNLIIAVPFGVLTASVPVGCELLKYHLYYKFMEYPPKSPNTIDMTSALSSILLMLVFGFVAIFFACLAMDISEKIYKEEKIK